jgi:hypothetical protein
MAEEKLKIEFGQPEHGWLPVNVRHGDFELKFEASDVPINPINQLISGIRQITRGMATEIWWHLEPAVYYFDLDSKGNQYNLRISFAKNDQADKELVYETQGKFEDIVMPFYRSIKSFFTQTIEELHWPKTDEREFKALTNILKGS